MAWHNKQFHNNQWSKKTIEERFKEKYIVNPITQCWEWQAQKDKDGYGMFAVNRASTRAHRFSYIWYIGDLSSSKEQVCHKCDNPCCVNPFHFFKGTQTDNFKDAQAKGRKPVIQHPSLNSYMVNKCRCEECVELMRKYWRESAARKYQIVKDSRVK